MTREGKGFWSSTSGVLTGTAGVLTGVVGLLTVLVQLDVIGPRGPDSATTSQQAEVGNDRSATTTRADATVRSARQTRSARPSYASGQPSFEVDPESVDFAGPLGDEEVVTVRNQGQEAFLLEQPEIQGPDEQRFRVEDATCAGAEIEPGGDCEMRVSFRPDTEGDSQATLVVPIAESTETVEVPLRGERLL